MPSTYCSVETVATELDCSVSTVRDYVKRGLLPQPSRTGGLVRWKWDAIVAMVDGISSEPEDPIMAAINGT